MMFTISPLLALVALITIPLSLLAIKLITARSRGRFIAQWRHTGTLNAQVEEAFTGHAIVKAFGRQTRGRGALPRQERGALRGELRRPVHLRA